MLTLDTCNLSHIQHKIIISPNSLPVFEEDGFPSQLCDGIKTQHGVTFLWCIRLRFHFDLGVRPYGWI